MKKVLHDHSLIQATLIDLVGELKEALETKQPAKLVPALESAIKNFAKVLPKLKFKPLIEMDTGITKEAQDLAKTLSASPKTGKTEVNAFIEKRWDDIKKLYMSHKFMKEKFGNKVIN